MTNKTTYNAGVATANAIFEASRDVSGTIAAGADASTSFFAGFKHAWKHNRNTGTPAPKLGEIRAVEQPPKRKPTAKPKPNSEIKVREQPKRKRA